MDGVGEVGGEPDDRPWWILPVIVFSQFAGTSLWFAGNVIIGDLPASWNIDPHAVGPVTSAVQFGFIVGTFVFAAVALADRFSPRVIFFVCSLLGAATNLTTLAVVSGLSSLLAVRFLTGLFLAGIYPIGMKIAAGWYRRGLGKALGFLVGALVLGTASPYLIRSLGLATGWRFVVFSTSISSATGGILVLLLVPNGPYGSVAPRLNLLALKVIFAVKEVRASVFSYFGHMWELYTFWAFTPAILSAYRAMHPGVHFNLSFMSFCVIAAGSVGCVVGGLISQRAGSARVAFWQMIVSGSCCVLLPLLVQLPFLPFLVAIMIWGIAVVGDSPQFSALTASYAPRELVGSALTIANCIGFGVTIVSIEATDWLSRMIPSSYLTVPLALGPALGAIVLLPLFVRRGDSRVRFAGEHLQ